MSDGKADAAGEKLQFSGGVSVIEIGQSHLPADAGAGAAAAGDGRDKAAAAPAAAADKAEPKAADAKADSPAADNKAAAAEPVSAKADAASAAAGSEKVTPKPDASPAAAQTPSASAAPAEPKSASHATEKKNGTTEPVTPNSPSTPATPAPGADAKASDAKGDAKADAKKADDKPKEKKKEKKEAKPVRDVNPALAARVKAANQYNRKWKAAKDAGLNDEEVAAAAAGGERRGTKVQADSKTPAAAAAGSPVVVTETEAERMRRERREKKDRLNLAEKVSAYHVDAMDPDLEAKVAAHEYADDTTAAPSVADLLKDNEKQGVLEERSSALIGYNWTPHTCVIHGGHFYWIKDEKKDAAAAGRVKFVKAKVRVEINDSVLELYDPDVPKKALQTRHFRVPETSGDFIDAWLLAIKRAKIKYYKAKGAQLLKEEEKQRKESGNPAPSAAVLSPQAAKAAALAAKRKAAQQMLTRGIQLMKHQAGTRYARAVWCTPQMDRVCWGDPKMDTVKGFVLLDDIIEVADHIALPMKPGAYGIAIAHNLHAFSGTDEAVLQFECDDSHARDAWVAALRAFTDKPN